MLTPHEKWFFDHHGFIILRKVMPPDDIQQMIELGNRWHDMTVDELPPPLTSTSRTADTSTMDPATVINTPINADDCVIFTEAL